MLSVPHYSSHQWNTHECGSITQKAPPPVEVEVRVPSQKYSYVYVSVVSSFNIVKVYVACHRMGRSPSWTRTGIVFLCLVGPLARASVPSSRPAFLGAYAMRERNVAAGRVTTGGARRPEIGKDVKKSETVIRGLQATPPNAQPSEAESEWKQELSWGAVVEKCSTQTTSRVLALKAWIIFVWFTFFSNYAPGPIPNPLDPAIISQVGGLTLNYFCVLPTLLPSVAPVFSPVMEGVFNLLLAWSVLFSGFLVDGRKKGSSINLFSPFMAAMVVLTNTAYLPYLVVRPLHTPETASSLDDLSKVERQLGESKGLLGAYGVAGVYSLLWIFFGRPDFGGLAERLASFQDLISTDRLMFAFTVELVLFGLFQGVMVDDDLTRRGIDPNTSKIGWAAKLVPFFGLIAYFLMRPPLPGTDQDVA